MTDDLIKVSRAVLESTLTILEKASEFYMVTHEATNMAREAAIVSLREALKDQDK